MSRRLKLTVRYFGKRILVSNIGLDHVSVLLQLCEIGNSWSFGYLNLYIKLKLRIFSKTNSSSWLRNFFTSSSRWLFEVGFRVFYIKQPKYHIDQDSTENRIFGWKNENPCLKNFSRVPSQKLTLGEVEESQGFPKVKHSKYKNGFFTMYSLYRDISGTIFSFPIGWVEIKIFGLEDFGMEVERS